MNKSVQVEGFALESADSVRFGGEFSPKEREHNRKILLGEALGGLLLGEPIWSNIPFAFDSLGLVEILGPLAKAFNRHPDLNFLPFQICAYDGDFENGAYAKWRTFSEVYTSVIANRLQGTFKFSSLPELDSDPSRRSELGRMLKGKVNQPWSVEDLDRWLKTEAEKRHFLYINEIDRFVTDRCQNRPFISDPLPLPIRQIRSREGLANLRDFLARAILVDNEALAVTQGFESAKAILSGLLEANDRHPDPKTAPMKDRSLFRANLIQMGYDPANPNFRVLIELADAHYVRTQYRSLSHAAREVSSPASDAPSSALGENWSRLALQGSALEEAGEAHFRFVNRLVAQPAQQFVEPFDLDSLFSDFAEMVAHPDTVQELRTFQTLLGNARRGNLDAPALEDSVGCMVDKANVWLRRHNVAFFFNSPARTLAVRIERQVSSIGALTPETEVPVPDLPPNVEFQSQDKREGSNNCVT